MFRPIGQVKRQFLTISSNETAADQARLHPVIIPHKPPLSPNSPSLSTNLSSLRFRCALEERGGEKNTRIAAQVSLSVLWPHNCSPRCPSVCSSPQSSLLLLLLLMSAMLDINLPRRCSALSLFIYLFITACNCMNRGRLNVHDHCRNPPQVPSFPPVIPPRLHQSCMRQYVCLCVFFFLLFSWKTFPLTI